MFNVAIMPTLYEFTIYLPTVFSNPDDIITMTCILYILGMELIISLYM